MGTSKAIGIFGWCYEAFRSWSMAVVERAFESLTHFPSNPVSRLGYGLLLVGTYLGCGHV
jgi:hypothetical protein